MEDLLVKPLILAMASLAADNITQTFCNKFRHSDVGPLLSMADDEVTVSTQLAAIPRPADMGRLT